jgi:serine/threonine-protein kinase HipA
MSLSGEHGMHAIRARHVSRLALELRLDETKTSARFRELAEAVAREAPALAADLRGEGLEHPIVETLSTAITRRAAQCVRWLGE